MGSKARTLHRKAAYRKTHYTFTTINHMQSVKFLPLSVFLVLFLSLSTFSFVSPSPAETEAYPPRWERLGVRKVNYRADRDEIIVTAREGTYSAVKLKVTQSPLNMRRMVIHYRNGQSQEVVIRKNFPRNSESRVIDLKGGKRVIQKVVFYYDTQGRRGRATVQLWGRR